MEKSGILKLTETQVICLKIPKIKNFEETLKLPQERQFFLIKSALRESVTTEDDQKIFDDFLTRCNDFENGWKKWIEIKTSGAQMEFQDIGGNRVNIVASKINLEMEMLQDRSMLRTPSQVLTDLRNKCFPGIDVIYQLRQDTGWLTPSAEFRNKFMEKMEIAPDTGKTIERPSFDKRANVMGNLKSKLEGVYFEAENKENGKITAFFDMPTLMKIIE